MYTCSSLMKVSLKLKSAAVYNTKYSVLKSFMIHLIETLEIQNTKLVQPTWFFSSNFLAQWQISPIMLCDTMKALHHQRASGFALGAHKQAPFPLLSTKLAPRWESSQEPIVSIIKGFWRTFVKDNHFVQALCSFERSKLDLVRKNWLSLILEAGNILGTGSGFALVVRKLILS